MSIVVESEFSEATDQILYKEWLNSKLLKAVSQGVNAEYIKTLLEAGADVNTVNNSTWDTALMYSATNSDHKTMEVLLKAGAEVERRKNLSTTALMCAVNTPAGNLECVELLVEAGANVYATNHKGQCPLLLATIAGHYDIVEFLLEKGKNVHASDNKGTCVLSVAAIAGHHNIVDLMIKSGADVNAPSDNGTTPLMHAASRGHHRCMKLLIKAGADESRCDHNGSNTIVLATRCSQYGISNLSLLKAAGALFRIQDINALNNSGGTPLMLAAYNSDLESLKVLIQLGADLECRSSDGNTVLLSAARNNQGSVHCIKELLEAGADVNVCNNHGFNALLVAASYGHKRIVQHLLAAEFDVNFVDYNGVSALSSAAITGYNSTIKLLLNSGADVNLAANDGSSPLMHAASKGRVKTLVQLLKAGADIDEADDRGQTALMRALNSDLGHSCVSPLAQAGANQPAKMSAESETKLDDVKRFLLQDANPLDLNHQCRKVIRRQLLWENEHSNLVATVASLPLPTIIKSYILYYEPQSNTTRGSWVCPIPFFGDYSEETKSQNLSLKSEGCQTSFRESIKIKATNALKTKGYRRMARLCNDLVF